MHSEENMSRESVSSVAN